MKKKRYLPFGYQMNEGNIIPDILEYSAVQSIFENYRNGASLQMLAKQMQQSGLKYRENAVWNKAMIARILDCEKYISEEFPAILPSDLFLQVQRLRKDRAQIYGGSLNPALRGIRDLICCQTCGQKLVRINHRDNVYIIWKCPSCNTETRYLPDIYKKRAVFFAYLLGKQFLKKLCSLNFSSLSSSRGSKSATISCGLRLLEKSDSPHCFSVKFQNVVISIRNRPPHGISSRVNSEIVLSE